MVNKKGFTLIELLVVLGIIALLLTLAVPRYFPSVDKTKETILADNLRSTRAIIDQYYGDTGRFPDSLEQLVEKIPARGADRPDHGEKRQLDHRASGRRRQRRRGRHQERSARQ